MEVINTYRTQISERFNALSRRNKILITSGVIVLIVLMVLAAMMMTRTHYVALVRGVTETKAAEITTKLDELGISWKSEANATAILVDETQIDKARMQLAIANITTDQGFTFADVMDRLSFTQTTEEKNKMFLYQTKSELESSFKSLDAIDNAVVMINVKESSSFLNLEEDVSSASVLLTIADGKTLSQDSVNGIVSFVQTAVKGLTKNTITIIDQNGVKLNVTSDSGDYVGTESQEMQKTTIEKRIEKSVIKLLSNIYGEENISVVTNVVLDFNSEQTDIVQFSAPVDGEVEGMIRSSNVLKENVVNGGSGGVAGTDSNTTDVTQYPTLQNAESDYTKTQEIYNRELNELKTTIVKAPGKIVDMSIAIIINSDVLEDNALPEANRQALIEMIAMASGAKDEKKISVSAWSFHKEAEIPIDNVMPESGFMGISNNIWMIVVAALVIIIILLIVFMRRRRAAALQQEVQEIIEEQEELEEINTEFQDRSSPKFQIEKFIEANPDAVANLLRSWMNDD